MRKELKPYTSPQSEIYRLPNHFTLLAGSGEGNIDGYGDAVNDGDEGGWHN